MLKAINSVTDDSTPSTPCKKSPLKPLGDKTLKGVQEKAKQENDVSTIKKCLNGYRLELVKGNESEFLQLCEFCNLEDDLIGQNKSANVSQVFDWLKNAYEPKRSQVAEFLEFYATNKMMINKIMMIS